MDKYYSLKETGLSSRELAALVGVSHMTIYLLYERKTTKLAGKTKFALDRATDTLLALVDSGKLPMKAVDREVRANNIEKLRAYIEKQNAA